MFFIAAILNYRNDKLLLWAKGPANYLARSAGPGNDVHGVDEAMSPLAMAGTHRFVHYVRF
ncbi:hypothetical protein CGZ80_08270 [Rhodopirellula sp. MGV]|nr:hypothetical protein CGZ80_08270 [Rhodopirellula sp. MGV]